MHSLGQVREENALKYTPGSQPHVLIVQADRSLARVFEHMVSRFNCTFYTTDLGEEAADLVEVLRFDFCILDCTLPDLCGHEVLTRMRSSGFRRPILFNSGADFLKKKALELGASDTLHMPFGSSLLMDKIEAMLDIS